MERDKLIVFQDKKIRRVWHNDEWYFSIVDVVTVLTESLNPSDYLKKLRKRDETLASYIGTNCPQVEMLTETRNRSSVISEENYLPKRRQSKEVN